MKPTKSLKCLKIVVILFIFRLKGVLYYLSRKIEENLSSIRANMYGLKSRYRFYLGPGFLFSKFAQTCKMRKTKLVENYRLGFGWDYKHKIEEILSSRNHKLGFCCTNFMNYASQ
jgi:hypothetical protein